MREAPCLLIKVKTPTSPPLSRSLRYRGLLSSSRSRVPESVSILGRRWEDTARSLTAPSKLRGLNSESVRWLTLMMTEMTPGCTNENSIWCCLATASEINGNQIRSVSLTPLFRGNADLPETAQGNLIQRATRTVPSVSMPQRYRVLHRIP